MNDRRATRKGRVGALRIEKDSDAVFAAAVRAGVLSEDPEKENFAGLYMYMHHDGDGTAWFKHRETRAYVTVAPDVEAPGAGDPKRIKGPGIGLWATLVLAGALLAGALVDLDRSGPGVGKVRLNDLTAEFLAVSVRSAQSPEASADAARTWGLQLEGALEAVAGRHGVVLFPAEAVAAGAGDYTAEVRAAMRSLQGAAPGSAAPGSAEPGTAAPGSAARGGSEGQGTETAR